MLLRTVSRPDDIPALDALFDIVEQCDGHAPIGEHKYLDLLRSDPTHATGLVGTEGDEVVAYVAVSATQETGTWAVELALHPMHRSRKSVRRLIDAGVGRAAESGADRVRMWAFQPNVVSVLEDGGFRPERELRQLRMTLPVPDVPRFPTSISIRSFRRGVDEDSWLEVNNAAFAGHPENGSWTKQVLEDRENQEWFDPGDFLMAWEAADLVGFCWTKRHSDTLGEIYVVAVAPAARGRGLGRTLVLEGLRHMAEVRQLTKAMLYVDADNAPALGLYEKLGFRLDHVDRSFVRDL